MSENVTAVVNRVARNMLVQSGVTGGRVFLRRADPSKEKPYTIITPSPAEPANLSSRRSFTVELNIRAVSESYVEAVQEAEKIRLALDDHGLNDYDPTVTDPTWRILSITESTQYSMTEPFKNASSLYSEGAFYTFVLEETNASICG